MGLAAGAVACASLEVCRGFGRLMLHLGRQLYFRRDCARSLFWLEKARGAPWRCCWLAPIRISAGRMANGDSRTEPSEAAGAYMNDLGSLALRLPDCLQALRPYRPGLRQALAQDDRRLISQRVQQSGLDVGSLEASAIRPRPVRKGAGSVPLWLERGMAGDS